MPVDLRAGGAGRGVAHDASSQPPRARGANRAQGNQGGSPRPESPPRGSVLLRPPGHMRPRADNQPPRGGPGLPRAGPGTGVVPDPLRALPAHLGRGAADHPGKDGASGGSGREGQGSPIGGIVRREPAHRLLPENRPPVPPGHGRQPPRAPHEPRLDLLRAGDGDAPATCILCRGTLADLSGKTARRRPQPRLLPRARHGGRRLDCQSPEGMVLGPQ